MESRYRRRVVAAAVALCAAAALPLAAQAQQPAGGKPKVALVMKSLANEFFLTMETGAKDYQKHNASTFDLVTNGIRNETDTTAQIQIVEQMIVSKVDAIVLAPADSKALVPVVKKAVDAGIIVVNIDNRLDPDVLKSKDLNVPFVGPDNRKGARLVGDYLGKRLKAGDEVGIVEGVSTTTNAQQRTAGFKDAMQVVGAKIVSVQSGEWEIDKGNAVASAMLNEYPNLKALLCGNDNMAIGAVSAVRAAGRQGKVLVVGYDNIDAIRPMLKDGRVLATADQFAAKQAVFGIDTALKALSGHKKQSELSGVVETPVVLVTK
ncbi:sugar ABC transporter substrate-binding protein [Paraburkholderia caballeronis]|uniref:Monosaccharide ABC transporter substrate-binding protein, CUT2 family n=1 Tax=Paraburkholderia caballeronis TaxID=416943 RepID=A0A1H7J0A4_9BURK|nr:sugar ABC transporter substrate-binding protein [Paraburkholderia caballeronis]PXW27616.1 monosaccharide ABC transporter substrate-binding protein (CUT2 family) [Paraburkholderia caballeronis]PXX03090.1 monosaccharide ABC transporter substrate-binding protein (CUT2 family) [Paraburkholderia caballeronis]RAK03815.1 monosaccharide ABC transporter substrate-binding protein (CUT2 family) [Paraburkholderia caballeronis]TDV21011.1 monosaccharide ABC transporter substrate-binding protein (CUT2 fami